MTQRGHQKKHLNKKKYRKKNKKKTEKSKATRRLNTQTAATTDFTVNVFSASYRRENLHSLPEIEIEHFPRSVKNSKARDDDRRSQNFTET